MLCILKLVSLFRFCRIVCRVYGFVYTLFPRCCVFHVCISVDYYSWLIMLCRILLTVSSPVVKTLNSVIHAQQDAEP
jgi:hypothetical protein